VFSDDGTRLTSLGNNEIKVYDLAGGRSITSVRAGADSGPQGMTAAGPIDQVATALSPNSTSSIHTVPSRYPSIGPVLPRKRVR